MTTNFEVFACECGDPHCDCRRQVIELEETCRGYEAEAERHERRFRETEAEWVDRFQTLEAEVERLRAALEHIGNVATSAALGLDDGIDHRWYVEEVARVTSSRHKEC